MHRKVDIKTCPECYSEINSRARRCAYCGSLVKKEFLFYHLGTSICSGAFIFMFFNYLTDPDPSTLLFGLGAMLAGIIIARS